MIIEQKIRVGDKTTVEIMEFTRLPKRHPLHNAQLEEGFLTSYQSDINVRPEPLTTEYLIEQINNGASSLADLPLIEGAEIV